MNELIKIEQQGNINTVNARELHKFLESKQEFSNWIKGRIKDYDFIEDSDFMIILSKSSGGRPAKEYHISIDTAKELSMVERNEKGKQARRYFIECEKKLKSLNVPQTLPEALRLAADQAEKILTLEQKAKEAQPKIETFDHFINADGLKSIGTVAKEMNEKGIITGEKRLFKLLRERKVLMSKASQFNEPYQRFIDSGYFKTKSQTFEKKGIKETRNKTFVTPKGENFIAKLLRKVNQEEF